MVFNYNSGSYSGSLSETDLKLFFSEFENSSQIGEWIGDVVANKEIQLYKRMQIAWTPILINDPSISAISASKEEFINQVVSHSSYKTAAQKVSGSL